MRKAKQVTLEDMPRGYWNRELWDMVVWDGGDDIVLDTGELEGVAIPKDRLDEFIDALVSLK